MVGINYSRAAGLTTEEDDDK